MPRLARLSYPWGSHLSFHCPGCGSRHAIQNRTDGKGPSWDFNGSHDRPTFSPSILVTWDGPELDPGKDYGAGPDVHHVCHSFVRDGQIQFLNDCSHSLAGKTVDLQEID